MDPRVIEQRVSCPYCAERISIVLDLSTGGVQSYVEDCQVCCQPMQIGFESTDDELVQVSVDRA